MNEENIPIVMIPNKTLVEGGKPSGNADENYTS
jgi:hypothetical protein